MASNSTQPKDFGAVLRGLLADREEYLTHTGNINWRAVAASLPGVHYETLRKAVAGDRAPTAGLMEVLAELVGAEPTVFAEYQLALVQRQFDVKEVGFAEAVENLRKWAEASTKPQRKR